jgi:hypothetical protein
MASINRPRIFSIKGRTFLIINPFHPGEERLIGEILRIRGKTMNAAGKEDGEFIHSNSASLPQELRDIPLAFPEWSPTADSEMFIYLASPLNGSRKRRCVRHPIFSPIGNSCRLVRRIV